MTDTARRHNLEIPLFALAFGLAIALRLLRLGEVPLSDEEARWAVQALDLSKGLNPAIDAQPAYVLLTALFFYVFQASNFAARLVPALVGSALVLAPMLFRDRLGNKVALILSFVLALEPGLLAISRQAGSPIIALSAGIFAWGFWRTGNLRAAGILAGMALLSGPALWPGVIGLAIAYGLSRALLSSYDEQESGIEQPAFDRQNLMTAGAYALGTYLAVGSLFLLVPGGLGAGVASVPGYLLGWVNFSDVHPMRLLTALAFYQILAIVLAVAGLVRGVRQHNRAVMSLGLWLLASLVLAVVYPSRQVADLAWVLIPLWTLASMEAAHHLIPIRVRVWETLGMLALTLAILFFAGSNFMTMAVGPVDLTSVAREFGPFTLGEQVIGPYSLTSGQVYLAVVLGAILLLGASIALVFYGWSKRVAKRIALLGSLWGALIVLAIYTFSTALGAANLRSYRTVELWASGPRSMQAEVLLEQMNDFSRWSKGADYRLDVFVTALQPDSPALHWLLRDWTEVTYSSEPTLTGTPAFVLAAEDLSAPELASAYRGQEFIWRNYPAWEMMLPAEWLRWMILHEVPEGQEKIILWTRSDIFVDSQNITTLAP